MFLMLCFVLAPGKDLAVSFWHFYQTSPCGPRRLSALASLFAPRTLPCAAVSRYPFNSFKDRECSDFPLFAFANSNHSSCLSIFKILHFLLFVNIKPTFRESGSGFLAAPLR